MAYRKIAAIGEMILESTASMTNKANVMTLDNQVMFCGNVTLTNYNQNVKFATLAKPEMYPAELVVVPVWVSAQGQNQLVGLLVDTDGSLKLVRNYNSATILLNGLSFHANSRYYTPEIGNIYDNGTSPLTA